MRTRRTAAMHVSGQWLQRVITTVAVEIPCLQVLRLLPNERCIRAASPPLRLGYYRVRSNRRCIQS